MIVKLNRAGKSFKGIGQYLTRDAKADTAERIGWTHTLNCANDHVGSAIHEMYNTYLDADLLKEAAGVKRGGQPLQKPVRHFSLSWHPDEAPTREQMIEATESFLTHMGWQDHQAVLVSHTDKPHPHVHVVLNAVHPETGKALEDSYSKDRAMIWAEDYQRERGQSYCPGRALPPDEREPSPTRPAWMVMKDAEREFEEQERGRQEAADAAATAGGGPKSASQEWDELKKAQREARQGFFADGRDAYREIRDAAFRQTREEFREEWAAFYKMQREGMEMPELMEIRADLVTRQQETLTQRRDRFCSELRETREIEFAGLLASHRAERAQLTARLSGDEIGQEIKLAADNQNTPEPERHTHLTDAFRAAATEVTQETQLVVATTDEPGRQEISVPRDDQEWEPRAIGPRMRSGVDIGANFAGGIAGGLGEIAERIFDGFFAQPVSPQPRQPATVDPPPERDRRQVFAESAELVKRRTELEDEERKANEWWDERRARTRD